jgi:hypothetical protein
VTKGLKDMVAEALQPEAAPEPVTVSAEAQRAMANKVREWSGWKNAAFRMGDPRTEGLPSPWAACNHQTRTFIANMDTLVLNPNRVLLTVTPFRLRQEAVLTGALLHEAGHARHTHWLPGRERGPEVLVHDDGTTPTRQAVALARLMEEPRVEGLMARNGKDIGAAGLEWTMRAAGAKLLPMTALAADPEQQVMDLITSWALRAGKQISVAHWTNGTLPQWVGNFTELLYNTLSIRLEEFEDDIPAQARAFTVINSLIDMAICVDDTGSYMVNTARDILTLLFPETDGDDEGAPMPGEGCEVAEAEAGMGGEGSDEGAEGTGNTEPEDEGSGDDPGAGDSGDDDSADETEPEQVDEDSEADGEDEDAADGATSSTDEGEQDAGSALAKVLRELEQASKDQTEDEAKDKSCQAPLNSSGGRGTGDDEDDDDGASDWRDPTKEEREIQKGAERFLRGAISPSESSRITLTDQPSSVVDGAALSAWKASGQTRAPHFFQRTQRTTTPSPPVKIAILVDTSGSMDELQQPSAILSWALSAAALDLRNFAGRGQQIESCLIHWDDKVRVIQPVGKPLPGLREFSCIWGTSALAEAFEEVENQMPGFFDPSPTPVNRLVVHFTDWRLNSVRLHTVSEYISKGLENGVNMISVVPRNYMARHANLNGFLQDARVQRGKSALLRYNPMFPEQVWETAAEVLDGGTPAPFAGF